MSARPENGKFTIEEVAAGRPAGLVYNWCPPLVGQRQFAVGVALDGANLHRQIQLDPLEWGRARPDLTIKKGTKLEGRGWTGLA